MSSTKCLHFLCKSHKLMLSQTFIEWRVNIIILIHQLALKLYQQSMSIFLLSSGLHYSMICTCHSGVLLWWFSTPLIDNLQSPQTLPGSKWPLSCIYLKSTIKL
jgi:hypothetical protein